MPIYMRKSTRRNNSARTSQWGIRCGAGRDGGCAAGSADGTSGVVPVSGAGLAGNGGDVNSGCGGIRSLHAAFLCPAKEPAQGCRTETVTQQGYGKLETLPRQNPAYPVSHRGRARHAGAGVQPGTRAGPHTGRVASRTAHSAPWAAPGMHLSVQYPNLPKLLQKCDNGSSVRMAAGSGPAGENV